MNRLTLVTLFYFASLAVAFGSTIDGTYAIEMKPLLGDGSMKLFPGVQPWEEKIEIEGSKLRFYTGARGPLVMSVEQRGDFLLATLTEEDGDHYFSFYRSAKDGAIHLAGKKFRKAAESTEVKKGHGMI